MAIVSVVKYDGNPDVFAWKYPDSELGTWTPAHRERIAASHSVQGRPSSRCL